MASEQVPQSDSPADHAQGAVPVDAAPEAGGETVGVSRATLEAEALPLMDLVYAVARRMVGEDAKAEDLVQETYLRAFRSAAQYRPGTNCKAWLLTILRSVSIDSARHIQSRGGSHEQLPYDVLSPGESVESPVNHAAFMSVLDVMVDDNVRAALLALPELYREAFVMVVVAELPYKEAATVLGVQEGTVKSRVFRACQMLKSKLWKYAIERRMAPK
jgi:RNA polymerase sigma-70 factor (ECF subfamily)